MGNLKYYNVVYRIINSDGIIDLSYKKKTIGAQNQESAVEILRSTSLEDGASAIRIDRIDKVENSSAPKIPEKKKKKSVLGWVAMSIFIVAMSAKLLSKLF